ncbi:MAG: phosphopantetheine-binding protein [bacterium]|nr:phosphopantetheine-binding protein [bacterium]
MPQQLINDDRIMEEVKDAIAETTGVVKEDIQPDSSLVDDLGVLSLDFLDVTFRLEQVFGIKMARNFVLEHVEEMFGEGQAIDENSEVTEKGVEILKLRLSELANDLAPGTPVDELPALVTPNTLASAVRDILSRLPEKSEAGADWKTEDGTHIVCAKTGNPPVLPSGDDLVREWLKKIQEEKKVF